MLVDYNGNRWEFNQEEAIFVVNDLVKYLKNSCAIDLFPNSKEPEKKDKLVTNQTVNPSIKKYPVKFITVSELYEKLK